MNLTDKLTDKAIRQRTTPAQIIKNVLRKKGYPVFENGLFNLNMGIIRNANRVSNTFDDLIYIICKQGTNESPVEVCRLYPATADPGLDHLVNPTFPEAKRSGSAILAEGYYRGLWKVGWFHGRRALLPRTKVWVYRDANRDGILDLDPKTLMNMDAGILMHESYQGVATASLVGRSSAGCQVPASRVHMEEIATIVIEAERRYPNSGTSYAVLNESDFNFDIRTKA